MVLKTLFSLVMLFPSLTLKRVKSQNHRASHLKTVLQKFFKKTSQAAPISLKDFLHNQAVVIAQADRCCYLAPDKKVLPGSLSYKVTLNPIFSGHPCQKM